ncbi:MarR family winged helix-turn-helix transcriptional regulator [Sporomusa aerivorans]|uniref:MarR family winged helix-turn-helix transcriptional regulator n=1 Tax=Sporomusa aerivorans TaxID=204936 RepID=UPI00352B7E22
MLEIFDSICVLLAKAEQKHFLYTKKLLEQAALEISPGQLVVLYALYKKDNIPISELSKNTYLDNSTLTGLIDRLERAGLVCRVPSPHDRRSYQIILTEKGIQVKPAMLQVMQSVENQMLHDSSAEDMQLLRTYLQRIFNNL